MTERDKKILLKDLCGRLPYMVFCNFGLNHPLPLQRLLVDKLDGILLDFYEDGKDYQVYLSEVKPYLRPMSDMTDEEIKELYKIEPSAIVYGAPEIETIRIVDDINQLGIEMDKMNNVIDYLNSIHIDHRGLIEKGLALPATEGMYKLKQ